MSAASSVTTTRPSRIRRRRAPSPVNGAVGGLVGANNGTITSSTSQTGAVKGVYTVGGLVGYNTLNIIGSSSSSTVTANSLVGGLVGHNAAKGSITGSAQSSGSVNGYANGD